MPRLLLKLVISSLLLASFSTYAAQNAKWSGLYVGLNAGYVWGSPNVDLSVLPDPFLDIVPAPLTLSPFISGGALGIQLGDDWQP